MNEQVRIPLLDLAAQNAPLLPEVREAFDRVFARGVFGLGQEVDFFEREIAAYLGVKHAIGVSSGTDALLAAMMALDIGPGDEVVTTPFSYFATAASIARLGAQPVFVDIDPITFDLDASAVGAALTEHTRAILPVHLFGQPCDMSSLRAISEAFSVPIVEGAAHALGAHHALGPVGGLGELATFSFSPSKSLGGFGDAGLVTTNDPVLADKVRILRAQGSEHRDHHTTIGGNFRLDTLQAAVLRVKLPHLTAWTDARRQNAALYDLLFLQEDVPDGSLLPPKRVEPGHVMSQYVIRVGDRDTLRAHLAERGIETEAPCAIPLHLQACFAPLGHAEGSFPEAELAAIETLALPMYAELPQERIERVVEEIASFLRETA